MPIMRHPLPPFLALFAVFIGSSLVRTADGEPRLSARTRKPASAPGRADLGEFWHLMPAPGTWDAGSGSALDSYDGFAWYRCWVDVPDQWKDRHLRLSLGRFDDCDETFFNGRTIGAGGTLPPNYQSGTSIERIYDVPSSRVRFGGTNFIALRVYDGGGRGGFKGSAPALIAGNQQIRLEGQWQFRTGDDPKWAESPDAPPTGTAHAHFSEVSFRRGTSGEVIAGNDDVRRHIRNFKPRGTTIDGSEPTPPQQALARLTSAADVKVQLVAAEPIVRQPLFLNFDERGRIWVVQYIQYPYPAGLKIVRYDEHLRAVFDKVPPPPPNHDRGADKITIHEDTDGDGVYDRHKVFLEGLNIATSVARGRGGLWVLNPPYLLFYPDRDNDDVPDSDPQVHLSGFGLEDTHAVANSLRWGPDGWLYGAQGSTCTATVAGVRFLGQAVWRYHPETRTFEVFAEGGGNTFCVEFDGKGRTFSGTNWGNFRGLHYVQGGCYVKNWGKHGPLINPHAYGFFPHMPHEGDSSRFSHNLVIYEGGSLPEQYHGRMISIIPLHNKVVSSDLAAIGSSFRTIDRNIVLETPDRWFRPVDAKVGPDGSVYLCDWYDSRLTHVDPRDNWDRSNGRIYRVHAKGVKPLSPFDLGKLSSRELVDLLSHENKWFRQQALRLLGDRKNASLIGHLRQLVKENTGQLALEALWAVNLSGGLDDAFALPSLDHAAPYVRLWTVRLIGDRKAASPSIAAKLAGRARVEPHPEVRSQLASTARRLPGTDGIRIAWELLQHEEDIDDPHIPVLIWWALENKAITHRPQILARFNTPQAWKTPMIAEHILERLVRRYAAEADDENLIVAAQFIRNAPGKAETDKLLDAVAKAFEGRKIESIPAELRDVLTTSADENNPIHTSLRLRAGDEQAHQFVLDFIANDDPETDKQRLRYIELLGQVGHQTAGPVLLDVVRASKEPSIQQAALSALQRFADPALGTEIVKAYPHLPADQGVRNRAIEVLSKRRSWAHALLQAVTNNVIDRSNVAMDVIERIKLHDDETLNELISRHWGKTRGTSEEKKARIDSVSRLLSAGSGNPKAGQALFTATCGTCHTLHGQGKEIGPDLTGYERDNLDFLLPAVLDPSAAIREEYTNYILEKTDGLLLTGFLIDQNPGTVTLEDGEQVRTIVPRDEIRMLRASSLSRMPENLLEEMTDQQIRDLFAYLRSKTPPSE